MSRHRILIAAILLAATAPVATAAPSVRAIDEAVRRTMDEFRVPGMAVSVVYEGELYHASGHGILEIGAEQPVNDETLFQIGSVSKAFTAAALAVLADEGELSFDDRVIDHLPDFRMHDPWVTREFTIRDLLTHRSGLPLGAGDLLMFPNGKTTRDEIVHALRYLEPSTSFRSEFAYDNLLYIVAGEVVAKVSGTSFEDFLERRLLAPLGMNDCAATVERTPERARKATPHLLMDGELETTGTHAGPLIAAAGGVTCSARGMARWMSLVLAKGVTADGTRLISEVRFDELLTPVTILPAPGYLAEHAGAHLNAYALGWGVSTFHGEPIYSHGGGLWGMTTFIAILPEQDLAVFASNNLMSAAPRAIVNEVVDRFLVDVSPDAGVDWIGVIGEASRARRDAGAEAVAKAFAARAADSTPSLPLEAYAGTYRDPWYGEVHVTLEDDGRLWFRSERNEPLKGPLEHFQYDTFVARWTDRQLMADAYVSFALDPEGNVERIRMKAVSPTTDFSFDFHDLDLARVPSP